MYAVLLFPVYCTIFLFLIEGVEGFQMRPSSMTKIILPAHKPLSWTQSPIPSSHLALSTTTTTSQESDGNNINNQEEKQRKARGLGCVLGGALIHLTLGTHYCWGNFISYAPEKLRFFDGQQHPGVPPDALYAMPINFALQSLVMPFSPMVVKAIGAQKALLLGGLIVSAANYFASFQPTLARFLTFYSVLFGAGIGLSYTIPMAAGWKWLPDNKGIVSGGVLAGLGIGGFIFSMIGSKTANPLGVNPVNGLFPPSVYEAFPKMLRKLGLIYAVLTILGSFLVTEPKVKKEAEVKETVANKTLLPGLSVGEALRSSQFWLMWTMIICSATASLNTVAVYKQFAATSTALASDRYLALVGGLGALCNAVGRLLWGYCSDKAGFKSSYKTLTLIQAALLVAFPFSAASPIAFALNTFAFFFCLAGNLALMPPAAQRMFGPRAGTTIYGILYSAFAFASIVGGILTKFLVKSKGWNVVFQTMTVMSLAATFLVTRLQPTKKYEGSAV
eukprot:gene6476-7141_t